MTPNTSASLIRRMNLSSAWAWVGVRSMVLCISVHLLRQRSASNDDVALFLITLKTLPREGVDRVRRRQKTARRISLIIWRNDVWNVCVASAPDTPVYVLSV